MRHESLLEHMTAHTAGTVGKTYVIGTNIAFRFTFEKGKQKKQNTTSAVFTLQHVYTCFGHTGVEYDMILGSHRKVRMCLFCTDHPSGITVTSELTAHQDKVLTPKSSNSKKIWIF